VIFFHRYAQKNDEKDKEHELLLDQSLEISDTFTNEKMKVEECIKKGKENYEESLQRAVAAEVSLRHLATDRYGNIRLLCVNYIRGKTALPKGVESGGILLPIILPPRNSYFFLACHFLMFFYP